MIFHLIDLFPDEYGTRIELIKSPSSHTELLFWLGFHESILRSKARIILYFDLHQNKYDSKRAVVRAHNNP